MRISPRRANRTLRAIVLCRQFPSAETRSREPPHAVHDQSLSIMSPDAFGLLFKACIEFWEFKNV